MSRTASKIGGVGVGCLSPGQYLHFSKLSNAYRLCRFKYIVWLLENVPGPVKSRKES